MAPYKDAAALLLVQLPCACAQMLRLPPSMRASLRMLGSALPPHWAMYTILKTIEDICCILQRVAFLLSPVAADASGTSTEAPLLYTACAMMHSEPS